VNPLLWIGGAILAAVVVAQAPSFGAVTPAQQAALDAAWPPSANVQQALVNQISGMFAQGGAALTSAQQTTLAGYVSAGSIDYAATIPAGSLPTVAGFQGWMLAQAAAAVAFAQQAALGQYGQGTQGQYGQGSGGQGQGAQPTSDLTELGQLESGGGLMSPLGASPTSTSVSGNPWVEAHQPYLRHYPGAAGFY